MRPVIRLYVPGILTMPGAADNWTGRGVTWTHLHTPDRAEKVEYFSGILTRTLLQCPRAAKLALTLSFYQAYDFDIHLAIHSNGADVALDALRLLKWPRIASLNLLSPACSADCNKNGLNDAGDSIDRVTVWIGDKDWPLALAGTKTGWLLGFGNLGAVGPKNAARDIAVRRAPVGHGGWFEDDRFNETMLALTSP